MTSLHLHAGAPIPHQPPRDQPGRLQGFGHEPLTAEEVAALLACAFEVKGCPTWGRGAPPAHHWQRVTLYVLLPQGAFRYDARDRQLRLVKAGDRKPAVGARDFSAEAPVHLVYVVDIDAIEQAHAEEHGVLAGADAGCIVENVYRHCAAAGLHTLVRAPGDRRQLADALGLAPSQRIELVQAVGHPPVH